MYQTIFNSIVNHPIVKEYTVLVEGKIYKLNSETESIIFALNVVCILEGVRMAYRICDNVTNNGELIEFVVKNISELSLIYKPMEEPLLCLTINKDKVQSELQVNENSVEFEMAIGKVLSYAYVGPDWYDISQPRYNIQYKVFYKDTDENISLYGFMCPISKWNVNIKNKILRDELKFNNVLIGYGYKCSVEIWDNKCMPIDINNL